MPPRDDQEWERRRQQIMAGALAVFSTHGFEKATNRQIVEAAGIGSPGLIYHYFKDKRDLFLQVLEHYSTPVQALSQADALMALPPRVLLLRLGQSFAEMLANPTVQALFRVMLGESLRRPAVAAMINQAIPGRMFPFMTRYFAQQMALGTLRSMDPGVATRSFVGPLIFYLLTTTVFPQDDATTLDPKHFVEQAVDIFLRGMAPDG